MYHIWTAMDRQRRVQFYALVFLSLIGALAEVISVGAVLPLVALAAGGQGAERGRELLAPFLQFGGPTNLSPLVVAALLLVALSLLSAAVRLYLLSRTQKFVFGLEHDLMLRLYRRVVRQRFEHFLDSNSSELIGAVSKIHTVGAAVLGPAVQALSAAIIATFLVTGLLYLSPFATAFAAFFMGSVYFLLSRHLRAQLEDISRAESMILNDRIKLMQETVGSMRDIILDRTEALFEAEMASLQGRARDFRVRSNYIQGAPRFIVEACGIAMLCGLALWFDRQPGGVAAALPVLGALALGAQRLIPLLQQIYIGWASATVHYKHLEDVMALMAAPQRDARATVADDQQRFERLDLNQVGFRYAGRPQVAVLDGTDFALEAGEKVGIVGQTGSGKSTLIDLIMGFLRPSSGELRVNGETVSEVELGAWQSMVAHVPQTIFLTDDSIAANIAFGDKNAVDRGRAAAAAAEAGLADFLASLPDGLDTRVGERGVALSGGQRQRIGIARALYKAAPILILDEATSALDHKTEDAIMSSIASLGRDLTVIVVSHRPAALKLCDKIYSIQRGRLAPAA